MIGYIISMICGILLIFASAGLFYTISGVILILVSLFLIFTGGFE